MAKEKIATDGHRWTRIKDGKNGHEWHECSRIIEKDLLFNFILESEIKYNLPSFNHSHIQ